MAVINIVVSIYLVKRIGIAGVILGTIISRVSTQVWYDPYLVFKYVFKTSVWKYCLTYALYGVVTVASCWITSKILVLMPIQNAFIRVFAGAGLSIVVPNVAIILLFSRTKAFCSVIDLGRNMLRRKL